MAKPNFSSEIRQFVKESRRVNEILQEFPSGVKSSDSPFLLLLRAARGDPLPQNRIVETRGEDGEVTQVVVQELVVLPLEERLKIATKLLPYVAPRLADVHVDISPPTEAAREQVVIYHIPDNMRDKTNGS